MSAVNSTGVATTQDNVAGDHLDIKNPAPAFTETNQKKETIDYFAGGLSAGLGLGLVSAGVVGLATHDYSRSSSPRNNSYSLIFAGFAGNGVPFAVQGLSMIFSESPIEMTDTQEGAYLIVNGISTVVLGAGVALLPVETSEGHEIVSGGLFAGGVAISTLGLGLLAVGIAKEVAPKDDDSQSSASDSTAIQFNPVVSPELVGASLTGRF